MPKSHLSLEKASFAKADTVALSGFEAIQFLIMTLSGSEVMTQTEEPALEEAVAAELSATLGSV